eukprot:TRINITY_DN170_c0_g2_i1.p1 TRINITY_DN170_c0_g2~~TRINITY_DN170_c0_g2_i1.p1  ORF type:complete len:209 (-),score=67.40 TRINITY_DN170_c0_g2_i1:154-780(-)
MMMLGLLTKGGRQMTPCLERKVILSKGKMVSNKIPSCRSFSTSKGCKSEFYIRKSPDDPFPPKIEKLSTEIAELNMIEWGLLLDSLGRKIGVNLTQMGTMAAPVAAAAPAASQPAAAATAAPAAEKKEEAKPAGKSGVTLKLISVVDGGKFKVLKEIRGGLLKPNLSVPESKTFVDNLPSTLAEGITKEEADKWVEKIKAAGGEVKIE